MRAPSYGAHFHHSAHARAAPAFCGSAGFHRCFILSDSSLVLCGPLSGGDACLSLWLVRSSTHTSLPSGLMGLLRAASRVCITISD
jgi:hypothetical protein